MNRNKKIAFFIDSLNCGGAEKSLVTLLTYISHLYKITIYVVKLGGMLEKELPNNVELKQITIPRFSVFSRSKRKVSCKLNYLLFAKKPNPVESYWKHYCKFIPSISEHFDIAIAYQQGFPTYFVVEKVSASKKIAWINADIIKQNYTKHFNIVYYNYYDNIVCVSVNLKQLLLSDYSIFNDKMIVINDIIPAERIIEKSKQRINDFHDACVNIVTVGRLTPVKGFDLALEAARKLQSQNVLFKWYFIGEGSERTFIERQISKFQLEDKIILTGALSNPYPYIRMADIYVQPSYSEGFGIALREAMILCKPIIATNFEVVYNLIDNGRNGIICKKDGDDIAHNVLMLKNDKTLCKHLILNLMSDLKDFTNNELGLITQLLN